MAEGLTLWCSGCGNRAAVYNSVVSGPAPLTIAVRHYRFYEIRRYTLDTH